MLERVDCETENVLKRYINSTLGGERERLKP